MRKKRHGAFWEDRYHATAVESDQHLLRCIVYIDLNMVRAGVVLHPSEWAFCGYNEIRKPRRKNILIDYQGLSELTGFADYDAFQRAHQEMVNDSLAACNNTRQAQWTESIAVGSEVFVKGLKDKLGALAQGRRILGKDGELQLREKMASYNAVLDGGKEDIGPLNGYNWDTIC